MSFLHRLKHRFARIPIVRKYARQILVNEPFLRAFPERIFRSLPERAFDHGGCRYILTDVDVPPDMVDRIGPVIRSVSDLSSREIAGSVFYVFFMCDSDALPELQKIQAGGGRYVPHWSTEKTSYRFVNRMAYEAICRTWTKAARVSHLDPGVHENLCEALELTRDVEGDYVEIGVYRGGSALTAINYLDAQRSSGASRLRKAWLLDTFEGFNYEEAKKSSDLIWAGTHQLMGVEATQQYVSETVSGTAIHHELIACNICTAELPAQIMSIAVANIDVDMYEPTLAALHKCAARMPMGGILVCEDPASTPALYGAYLAMHEFLATPLGGCFMPIFKQGQYFLLRQKVS